MNSSRNLEGLVPERLAPCRRKIVFQDLSFTLDMGFHEMEIGNPQRLLLTIEVGLDEASFAASDDPAGAWDYDVLKQAVAEIVLSSRFNLQETIVLEVYNLIAARRGVTALRVASRKPDIYPDCGGVGVELSSF